jgi:RimJ/RimL family protein N-acetyltransferase
VDAGTVTAVRGRVVVLRPLRPEEFDVLASVRAAAMGVSPDDQERLRDRVEHSGEFHRGEVLLGIESVEDGRLVGEVQIRHPEHAFPAGVWELGIEVFDPADRGRGLGGEATWLISGVAFEQLGANRVQATTDVENAAMRGALERLGFGFEGVLRGFWPVPEGTPRDYAMYGITHDDYLTKKRLR